MNSSTDFTENSSMENSSDLSKQYGFDWAYGGVDYSIPGTGGDDCVNFLSVKQRIFESILASIIGSLWFWKAYPNLKLPNKIVHTQNFDSCGKRILLVAMCLTFGIELGYKFATRQVIWILNPCHMVSMIQIFILAAPPGKAVMCAFRFHLHMLTGAPIALIFPVINTRLLPFETEVYYIQHVLMLIIPFYLMSIGGVFTPEKLTNFNWTAVSSGFLFVYHFVPLQYLAYVSKVNLNNMLCPAISDPFYGPYYRWCAMTHQILLLFCQGKVLVLIFKLFSRKALDTYDDTSICKTEKSVQTVLNGKNETAGIHKKVKNDITSNHDLINGHLKMN